MAASEYAIHVKRLAQESILTTWGAEWTISTLKSHINKVSIFTHNGILRCLIGNFFQIDKKDWFKIFIPHGIKIEFIYLEGKYYPNISKNILPRILKNIGLSSKWD